MVKPWWEADLTCGGTMEWGYDPEIDAGDKCICEDHGIVTAIAVRKMPLSESPTNDGPPEADQISNGPDSSL